MNIESVLQKYNVYDQDIEILQENSVEKIVNQVPDEWIKILQSSTKEEKIDNVMNIWKKRLARELSITINYLENNLEEIELVRFDSQYYLLYIVNGECGTVYYIGGNPLEAKKSDRKLPQLIKTFYSEIHNGFYDYCFKAMGLVSIQNIELLWEDLDYSEYESKFSHDTYAYFINGLGDSIAYDEAAEQAIFWLSKEQSESKYGINFWDYVDEWLCLGLRAEQ